MKKIRLALVGAGNIANVHLKAYQKDERVELTAICDINEDLLNRRADEFGIEKRFTNIDDMLSSVELDAADICVWNCSHAECTIKALNAGLNVLCEKPMAMSAKEAEEMEATAKKNGKLLMIGFVTRFSNEAKIAKDFIDKGYLGDVYYSKAIYLRRNGNPGGWFSDTSRSGGGPLIDIGVHPLDLTRYLMGNPKPVSVYCVTSNHLYDDRAKLKTTAAWMPEGADPKKDKCDIESNATAIVRYENGACTLLEASYALNTDPASGRTLYGTKGSFCLDNGMKLMTDINGFMTDVKLIDTDYLEDNKPMFERETSHFIDCCLGEAQCVSTAADGVVIMKILDALYESARTGHEVTL